ncbi:protein BCL9 homolog isoform X2 [Ooceraea biroi]|uniref:protein BCL9 homolog isoform X2 n=1 Tax=Ooceraea biroi TaxID=2015173 RepID=UPI000F08C98F|nr:protein BCL9 homolog isoform X2 [Ooceraea biroi]
MKTEKKPNEPSCCPPSTVVKEEPDADPVKIKEEGASGNNDDTTGEDASECPRDPCLDPSNGESTMTSENQNANGNQQILNSVKQEGDPNNPTDDLPADSIQPLVSNVVAKQMGTTTGSGDTQYMQQQSQIYVFSTMLANKGADAVLRGDFISIIAYHQAQPGTKKYLEKGHQGNANNTFPTEQPPDLPALDPNAPQFWNEQPNLRNINGGNSLGNSEPSLDDGNIDVPCLVPNSPGNSANPQSANNATMGHSPNLLGGTTSPGPGNLQPSLQGVKVPDENLTPRQRQHREVQLATLRKMQMMLFPGHKDEAGNTLTDAQGTAVSCPPTNVPPVGVPNQCNPTSLDWHKLQHQFLEGKPKSTIGNPGAVSLRGANMVGIPRSQGPPPPYHQTTRSASVPIAIQSPNPSSPNNPTSNLSLPSPRASSALNSPADCNRQFQLGNQRTGHLPGQSPTSQDSPNPTIATAATAVTTARLNHSNPGTPVSHSHIAALSPSGTTVQKDASLDFATSQPPNVDGMFCRTLQSLAQQKQQHTGNVNASTVKEANLMPVPSPHQLQYLSTFEGQELTIQKQPNTSLKDGNSSTNVGTSEISNRILPGSLDSNNQFPTRSEGASPVQMDSMSRGFTGSLHSPNTPNPIQPHTPNTPGSAAPHTPADPAKQGNKSSASAQSSPTPHNTAIPDSMGPPRIVPASPTMKPDTSPPSVKDVQQQQQQQQQPQSQQQPQQQQPQQQQQQQPPPQQQQPTVVNPNNSGNPTVVPSLSGGASFPCGRSSINVSQPSDNVPLNPNNIGGRLGNLNTMSTNHFDPITSLAQMSQQLTNTAASNSLGNEPMHSGNTAGMMPFGNPHAGMHMMQMGGEMNGSCHMGGTSGEPGGEVGGMCMGLAGPPTSYSPTQSHTSHTGSPGVPSKMGHPMMGGHGMISGHSAGSASGPYPGGDPGHAPPPRLMTGHGMAGPSPYNGANVQVKPNAPNTIQYLPARPNVGHAPRGPPSLDFLQRFTNPLPNLESKMGTPSVNLQYFPNGCVPNSMAGPHSGMPSTMNAAGIPGMGGSPRMDGQPMNTPGTMHPSMRPVGNMRPQPNLMRMQHMVGGGVFPGGSMDPDKVFPPDMVSQSLPNQSNPGMYGVPGNKGSPMGLGPPPDATQPLPPSMGGATGNFKNSPFVGSGPSMSDPNYAQQFHNFQQQLYATGTRGSGPPHPNLHPPPNSHSHQQFFMPK